MGHRVRPTRRTRSKINNGRPPVRLSNLAPEDFNVRPDETRTIACPDCRTWRRIMGNTDLKIREHPVNTTRTKGEAPESCPGSHQAVLVDIDVRRWQARQDRLLRDAMPQDNRRAARQFYKPIPAPAVPVHEMRGKATLDSTRQAYLAHREACIRCVGGQHCLDGGPLARRFVLALQQDPVRREGEREAAQQMRRQERARLGFRSAQWGKYGAAVEAANNQCRTQPEDTVSDFRAPEVPLTTLHPQHHVH